MRRAFRTHPSLVCCNIPIANLPISGRFGKGSQGGKSSPQRVRRVAALEKDFVCEGVAVGAPANSGIYSLFSAAVLVRPALFVHSNLPLIISSDCSLPRASWQMCVCPKLPCEPWMVVRQISRKGLVPFRFAKSDLSTPACQ
jgi:hypothetical protein